MSQLEISEIRSPDCPFGAYIDDDDNHCCNHGLARPGYDVLAEDHKDIDHWLQEINWVGLDDIEALNMPVKIPVGYVPTITDGAGKLFSHYEPNFVAIRLKDVVSGERLSVAKNLDKFHIPPGTGVILLCYGLDRLIENIWPRRDEVFSQLAKLPLTAITGINYSIWDFHPHAERLINIKRGLITFAEMQRAGLPAIPHIYWSGKKNLLGWSEWLRINPTVKVVAINLQTLRKSKDWGRALSQLTYFTQSLDRPIHFLVTGCQSGKRLEQLQQIMPQLTLTNGTPCRRAFAGQKTSVNNLQKSEYSAEDRSLIFKHNVNQYDRLLKEERSDRLSSFLSNGIPEQVEVDIEELRPKVFENSQG